MCLILWRATIFKWTCVTLFIKDPLHYCMKRFFYHIANDLLCFAAYQLAFSNLTPFSPVCSAFCADLTGSASKDDSVLSRPVHRRTTKTRSASQIVNNRLSCCDFALASNFSAFQHQSLPLPSLNGKRREESHPRPTWSQGLKLPPRFSCVFMKRIVTSH